MKKKVNEHEQELEFGGPIGATILIIWSHYILYYFWYCYAKDNNNGQLIIPTSFSNLKEEINEFIQLFIDQCIPDMKTCGAYFSFFFFQILLAAYVPGWIGEGVPIDSKGTRMKYLCNGYLCYYICLWGFFLMHNLRYFYEVTCLDKVFGEFISAESLDFYKATHLCDNFGRYITTAIIVADVTSIFWYLFGIKTETKEEKNSRTKNVVYDFFIGTILYPRIGIVDVKMIAECRWSWLTLMLLTTSCAVKQAEINGGWITKEMGMMVLAHWLYSNATVKGEHYIPCTWDMFHERFGWMLNFWNTAGVPYLYCFQSFYIVKNYKTINNSYFYVVFVYVLLLIGYYIFDSANCQKASIKMPGIKRNTFPQVPWSVLRHQPIRYIETPKGNLLVDGWYAFARKLQYTGDLMMALSWGLICGPPSFKNILNYFYFIFFLGMIIHRQSRDEVRCKAKYGEYWDVYTKEVPNVFIPNIKVISFLLSKDKTLPPIQLPKHLVFDKSKIIKAT